jgi:hypothetical protein
LTEEGAEIIAIDIDIAITRDMGRRPSARKSIELRLGGFRIRNTVAALSWRRPALRGEPER